MTFPHCPTLSCLGYELSHCPVPAYCHSSYLSHQIDCCDMVVHVVKRMAVQLVAIVTNTASQCPCHHLVSLHHTGISHHQGTTRGVTDDVQRETRSQNLQKSVPLLLAIPRTSHMQEPGPSELPHSPMPQPQTHLQRLSANSPSLTMVTYLFSLCTPYKAHPHFLACRCLHPHSEEIVLHPPSPINLLREVCYVV